MSASIHKFLLKFLLIMGVGVQTCTLHFPPAPEEIEAGASSSSSSSSSSSKEDFSSSSSSINQPSSSSSAENQYSSSSELLSSSEISPSSSSLPSSSSIASSSSITLSSSSIALLSSSSIVLLSSSSACTAKNNTQTQYCSGGTMKEYGSMTDGTQTYKTVVIANQTWMAANLNYNPNKGQSKCYAEHKQQPEPPWLTPEAAKANCDKYGRLYDWETAMNLSGCNSKSCASQVQKPHKGICPSGWHLPDTSEWGKLRRFIEKEIFDNYEDEDFGWDVGTKLKATTGWKETSTSDKGVDSYGFGAIGTGYCVSCDDSSLSSAAGFYSGEKEEAHWWTATEYINQYTKDATQAYKTKVTFNKKVLTQETEKKADYLYSIRCVKD